MERIPSQVDLESEFEVTLDIMNCSESEIEPILQFENKDLDQSVYWLGISGMKLETLKPMESTSSTLTAYSVKTGLQPLSSITIHDKLSKTCVLFENYAFVFVN